MKRDNSLNSYSLFKAYFVRNKNLSNKSLLLEKFSFYIYQVIYLLHPFLLNYSSVVT